MESESEIEIVEVTEIVVRRPRGRPRKAVVETEPQEPKKRGRPRTLPVREPVEKMKTGPKTNLSSDKAYFKQN